MVESVRDQRWVIPKSTGGDDSGVSLEQSDDVGVRLLNQLTAPYKTLTETKSGKKRVDIEVPGNQRDDMFDVMTFCWLALNEVGDDESVVDFSISAR